jgi:hypothetical protein
VTAATAAPEQQQQHLTRKLMQILEVVTEASKKGTGKMEFAFLLKLEFCFLLPTSDCFVFMFMVDHTQVEKP